MNLKIKLLITLFASIVVGALLSCSVTPKKESSTCDLKLQPAPHYGMKAGTCYPSCGVLGGTSELDCNGLDEKPAYDVPHCCMPKAKSTTTTTLEPVPTPKPENPHHVKPGPVNEAQAKAIVFAVGNEFAYLKYQNTLEQKILNTETLQRRIIWHLHLAGFQAGRQKNPSGAISKDKFSVFYEGSWHAIDFATNWDIPDSQTTILFLEVDLPNYIPDPGLAD